MCQILKLAMSGKFALLAVTTALAASAYGQQTTNLPLAQTNVPSATGNTIIYNPGTYNSLSSVNYIRERDPKIPMTDINAVISSLDVTQVNQHTQYMDGLGRSLQTVRWQGSPNKTDIVAPVVYDAFGREVYKFLPYSSSGNDGSFQIQPFTDQNSFYTSVYPAQQTAFNGEQFFYSKTVLESSPLNRINETFAPGNNWAGSEGSISSNEHATNFQYLINNINDQVILWGIANTPLTYQNGDVATNIPYSNGVYNAGQLSKTVTTDVHKNSVVEYKDKEGHVVLKKVQVGNTVPVDYSGQDAATWLCTYYVYDYFGLLRFVIPPKAANQSQLTTDVINELCFRYEYDEKHRLIAQKTPGKGWEYMVYDIRDRLVFYQDANLLNKGQWLYNLYDELDRVIQTGVMQYNTTRDQLQITVNNIWQGQIIAQPVVSGNSASSIAADLVLDTRIPGNVNNDYKATNSITIDNDFTSETGAEFVAEIVTGNSSAFNTSVFSYSNPIPPGATLIPLSLNFFDNYSWTSKSFNNNYSGQLDIGNNNYADPYPSQQEISIQQNLATGKLIGSRIRVLEDVTDLTKGAWLETVSFFDAYGRTVQMQADNYKGGTDIVNNRYNFTGTVVSSYFVHNNPVANVSLGIKANYNYDFAGRIIDIRKKVIDNNNTTANYPTRIVAAYQYDALGKVLTKSLGGQPETGVPSLESLNYNFNINGALKSVNGDYCKNTGNTNHYFGYDLSYDWGFVNSRFDGSITGMRWKSKGSGNTERAYGFGYDNADRFTKADFTQRDKSDNWNTTDGINYSVQLGDTQTPAYDENGNIKKMQQYGLMLSGSSQIDNLTYQYNLNNLGNQLNVVTDGVTSNTGLGDFTKKNTAGNDYSYDANGNLLLDNNKKITGINYNYLDLPSTISINNDDNSAKSVTTYIYDASGNKLEKRVQILPSSNNNNQSKTITTTYIGGFVYKDNVLQYFNHEEGRVRFTIPPVGITAPNNFVFDYFITDQLSNVRTVLTDEVYSNQAYQATVEPINLANEVQLFGDVENQTKATKPQGFDNDPNNTQVTQLVNYGAGNISSQVQGPGLLLKVMAGDVVSIRSFAWYLNQNTSPDNSQSSSLAQVITNLLGSTTNGIPLGGHFDASSISNAVSQPVNIFVDPTNPKGRTLDNSRPKAYINWILFNDEQLKVQDAGTGFVQVPQIAAGATKQVLQANGGSPITMPSNGYLYVFVSNESTTPVYFDDLHVDYTPGPLREENHYYPAGLQMTSISSHAYGALINNNKYQGAYSEYEEETGYNEFRRRMYDPQISRWTTTDPKHQFASGYIGMGNNPESNVDPDGAFTWLGAVADWIAHGFRGFIGQQVDGIHNREWFVNRISDAENNYISDELDGTISSTEAQVFNRKIFGETPDFHQIYHPGFSDFYNFYLKNAPFRNFEAYVSVQSKATFHEPNTSHKVVVPVGIQGIYSSSENNFETNFISPKNTYYSYGFQGYLEGMDARVMPGQMNIDKGDYVPLRGLITVGQDGPAKLQLEVSGTSIEKPLKVGVRGVIESPILKSNTGTIPSISIEANGGFRFEIHPESPFWPHLFNPIGLKF